ncbi:hypothetical protein AAG906_035081 [Vitis piasezkii]
MGIAITYEILLSLQEMFGDKDRLTRQVALRTIMNTKMIEITPVSDHMVHLNSVHMAVKDSSDFSRNKKKKNSFKKSKQGNNKAKEEKSKGKGKCFIYGKKDH